MCGIAGIFNFNGRADVQLHHVVSMANAMKHRGPDDEGFVLFQEGRSPLTFFGNDTPDRVRGAYPDLLPALETGGIASTVALGHRRLSILDLSPGGHQPMCSHDWRYWIVYNGEIYNYIELRQELKSLGHRFKTESDTEVILAAYSQWKENCLKRFNGDWAFVVWDCHERSLFCARDRIGIKPFYYVFDDKKFIFASDIKTLIASGLYTPEPDPQGLYLAMAFGIAPRPITAFRGIRALKQAYWMRIQKDGTIQEQPYWRIPVNTQITSMSEGEAEELLELELTRAIKRRLVADVPVGTFMSGGVDSTTISAIASRIHPGIKAFTLGYEKNAPEMDEVSQAVSTAEINPMTHIVKRIKPDDCLGDLNEWVDGYEEPFYSLAPNYVISKLVKENNVTVVLNGLGGDELFAGYSYYKYYNLPRLAYLNFISNVFFISSQNKFAKLLQVLTSRSQDRMHTSFFAKNTDTYLKKMFVNGYHQKQSIQDVIHSLYAKDVKFSDTVEAFSYMDILNYIGNHHVHRVDQFTMAHSVEGRFPFLDHELIESAFSIPSHLKINAKIQKFILKKVAKKYIHQDCLSMKKKGFGLPLKQWMVGPLKKLVDEKIICLQKRKEINAATVKRLHVEYNHGKIVSSRIWHLVALELWFERFIDSSNNIVKYKNI